MVAPRAREVQKLLSGVGVPEPHRPFPAVAHQHVPRGTVLWPKGSVPAAFQYERPWLAYLPEMNSGTGVGRRQPAAVRVPGDGFDLRRLFQRGCRLGPVEGVDAEDVTTFVRVGQGEFAAVAAHSQGPEP